MMKRLLVLAMVLAVAPFATATLSIGTDGGLAPDEITIGPGDLILDIRSDGDLDPTFMLVVDNAYGSISGGNITANSGEGPFNYNFRVPDFAYYAGISPDPWFYAPTVNGISWLLGWNSDWSDISGVVFEEVVFEYGGPGGVVIQLWNSPDLGYTWSLDDTLTVHQIPEPLTMALLGLGGLFLRRRK